jgi:hypothetical protein
MRRHRFAKHDSRLTDMIIDEHLWNILVVDGVADTIGSSSQWFCMESKIHTRTFEIGCSSGGGG